jgi:selenocysteine-specific elongation factor
VPFVGDVQPGQRGPVRLLLDRPVAAWTGDRFVLREAGRGETVAGGRVLDPAPRPLPDGADARFEHALVLEALDEATDDMARIAGLVDAHGGVRAVERIVVALGLAGPAVVTDAPGLVTLGGALVRNDLADTWVAAAVDHAEQAPRELGVERSELARVAQQAGSPQELARPVVDLAHQRGALAAFGTRSVHPEHVTEYLAARALREQALLDVLGADPLEPPDPDVAAEQAGALSTEVQSLIDAGRIIPCGPLQFTADAVHHAIELLRAGPGAAGAPFTASEARVAWGTTRRCAVPLLEHLRTTGVTRFDGESHTLLG